MFFDGDLGRWIDEMVVLTNPDQVVLIDGSEAQLAQLRSEGCASGELVKLNEALLPGCYYHRSDPSDVARVEERTFLCTPTPQEAGPTNRWKEPRQMIERLRALSAGGYRGRTCYVIPYAMGIPGSPFCRYGIELTDSIYVVLSMAIMTRVTAQVLSRLQAGEPVVRGMHLSLNQDPKQRYICHFPQDNLVWTINSCYGGNVLMGKKCYALRLGSYLGRKEGWLAEHMLILGIERPGKPIRYVAAAFPSACGKTNLAMLTPPDYLAHQGIKVTCVGDDIAWIHIGTDGRFWAVNPENGFFGVAPGTSERSNPNALSMLQNDTIFTNTMLCDDGTIWWEGMGTERPTGQDWRGEDARADLTRPAAHPNSRFTSPTKNCPCLSPAFDSPQGVPLSAIVFGGRRAKTAPLVYQARDFEHGVFVGAAMASETTAAAEGKTGVLRHDPMAMLPFCGYHMGDYFAHWLQMGQKAEHAPAIFHVNWFRRDAEGRFLWPGFGDNLRVLLWMLERCDGAVSAVQSPIGLLPKMEDLDLTGLDLTPEQAAQTLFDIDPALWSADLPEIKQLFETLGDRLPQELWKELNQLEHNLCCV